MIRAPSLGNRSPTKPTSQNSGSPPSHPAPNTSNDLEAEEEVQASSRYNRLKERNQILASRPGYTRGPGIIVENPVPNDAQLKDTSVVIASAFHQAAASSFANMANDSWRTGNTNLPRSTSVEYEKETQSTSHRRLAVPASRTRPSSSKPNSRASNRGASDVENESRTTASRAKSPFDHLADLTRRAMSPGAAASFLLRAPSREPDVLPRTATRQATDATLVGQTSESYDYAAEEEEMQRMDKTSNHASSSTYKKPTRPPNNRISTDNQAYKPSESEYESDEDDMGKKTRRRKKKKDSVGGPLTTLPVTQYDKRKKRKGRSGKGGEHEESGSDGESIEDQAVRVPLVAPFDSLI